MKIETVTFTGADDYTEPTDLLAISKEFPFVEWGILFPSYGASRFPSKKWVDELLRVQTSSNSQMQLSAHICEPYVENLISTGDVDSLVSDIGKETLAKFQRIQLNQHGHQMTHYAFDCIKAIQALPNEVIIQADGVNTWIVKALSDVTSVLYDTSSGAGDFDNVWPTHRNTGRRFGYAGGLNSQTLPQAIEAWKDIDDIFWIDMETGVRSTVSLGTTEYVNIFDLDKVVNILNYIDPYIGPMFKI